MTAIDDKLVRPEIAEISPYVPGKPIDELKRELGLASAIKLASNENPLGPSPKAVAAMADACREVHLYPDGGAYYLKEAIADSIGVTPDELLVANGSNEAIEILIQTFGRPGDRTLTSAHSFIVYKLATMAAGFAVDEVAMGSDLRFDLDALAAAIREDTRFVCIANPNNPTGTWLTERELVRFLERVPRDTLVLLDEAYFEYAASVEGYPNGLALRARFPDNLIVLRTFSKAYGLAGVRLGYAVLPKRLAGYCDRVRAPFNTSLLAQRAGVAALGDTGFLERSLAVNAAGRDQLVGGLARLGIESVPSIANFVLARFETGAQNVFASLLERGVIVRPMAGYGLPEHVRITVGLPEELTELLGVLEADTSLR